MKKFPILNSDVTIDWEIIEPHREQAYINHSQTLERLAERGGLSWYELSCVLLDKSNNDAPFNEKIDYRKYIMQYINNMGLLTNKR